MKKLIALLLALLILGLAACGVKEDESLYGTWKLYAMDYEDAVLFASDLFEYENYIEISKGGKCSLSLEGESAGLLWKSEGSNVTFTASDGTMPATVENGILALDVDGQVLYFVADGADVSSLNAVSLEDYLASVLG